MGVTALVVAAARVLDVTLAGIVTNDSLGYLQRAEAPFGAGFVTQGYRQALYPIFVSLSNLGGDVLGWDHVFGVALAQRLVLVAALVAAVWALRWWSIPIVAIATSSTFVLHTDLLLPEGLLIPLCLICAAIAGAAACDRIRQQRHARIALIGLCAAATVAAGIKLQYAVLLAVALAVGFTMRRDGTLSRREAAAPILVAAALVVLLALAQAFENRSELGVFEPVSERARAEWYGAWQAVFNGDLENQRDPELAEFYADGDLYEFLHGIERSEPDYPTRAEIIRARVESMFEAAATSARAEQVDAFAGGLAAARFDDIEGIIDIALDAGADPLERIRSNSVGRESVQAVIDGYNEGFTPGVATFGPVLSPAHVVLEDHRPMRHWVSWLAIGLSVLSLSVPGRHRAIVLGCLAVTVGAAGALATGYIDNARYLLGPFTIAVVGGTIGLRALLAAPPVHNLIRREK